MTSRTGGYAESPIGRTAGGCLKRLMISMVLLLITLGVAVFLFGRALLGL